VTANPKLMARLAISSSDFFFLFLFGKLGTKFSKVQPASKSPLIDMQIRALLCPTNAQKQKQHNTEQKGDAKDRD